MPIELLAKGQEVHTYMLCFSYLKSVSIIMNDDNRR